MQTAQLGKQDVENWVKQTGMERQMANLARFILKKIPHTFKYNVGGGSYTDKKTVTVGIPEISFYAGEQVWVILSKALTFHESEHVLISDFKVYALFQKQVQALFLRKYSFQVSNQLGAHLLNSTEDGRIEKSVSNRYLGAKKMIKFLNAFFWKHQPATGQNEFMEFMYSFTSLCVTGLKMKDYELYYGGTVQDKLLDASKPLIQKCLNSNAQECADITMEIAELFSDYIYEKLQEQKNQDDLMASNDGKAHFENSQPVHSEGEPQRGLSSSHFLGDDADADEENQGKGQTDPNADENGNVTPSGLPEELSPEEIEALVDEQIEKFKEDLAADANRTIEKGEKEEQAAQEKERRNSKVQELSPQELEEIMKKDGFEYSPFRSGNKEPLPQNVVSAGKYLNREFQEIFEDEPVYNRKNQRRGLLDTSALTKFVVNDVDAFEKRGSYVQKDKVFSVLIDHSGSMTEYVDGKTKLHHAKEAATALELGLKGVFPLRVAHFTSHGTVSHSVVKDFDHEAESGRAFSWERFPGIINNLNRDGKSIEIAAAELLNRPEEDKILIVLSDGLPSQLGTRAGQEEVQKAVQNARDNGIKVYAIGFGNDDDLRDNRPAYEFMYEEGIVTVSPKKIAKELVRIIREQQE